MYSMITDPKLATQIARQQVDERIRDAEARRTAREVSRAARAQSSMPQPTQHSFTKGHAHDSHR